MADHQVVEKKVIVREEVPSEGQIFAARAVGAIFDVILVLLLLRFVLRLLSANEANGFVNLVYAITMPLRAPFAGIFPVSMAGAVVIEWSTLVAILVYSLIAYFILRVLRSA